MSRTPEGRVKDLIRELLDGYKGMWYYMPVPSGYGRQTIDFIGCFRGRFFGIEAKVHRGIVKRRQLDTMHSILKAGGATFVVEGEEPEGISALEEWLLKISRTVPHVPVEEPPANRRPI